MSIAFMSMSISKVMPNLPPAEDVAPHVCYVRLTFYQQDVSVRPLLENADGLAYHLGQGGFGPLVRLQFVLAVGLILHVRVLEQA